MWLGWLVFFAMRATFGYLSSWTFHKVKGLTALGTPFSDRYCWTSSEGSSLSGLSNIKKSNSVCCPLLAGRFVWFSLSFSGMSFNSDSGEIPSFFVVHWSKKKVVCIMDQVERLLLVLYKRSWSLTVCIVCGGHCLFLMKDLSFQWHLGYFAGGLTQLDIFVNTKHLFLYTFIGCDLSKVLQHWR